MATPLTKHNAPYAVNRCVRHRDRSHGRIGGQGILVAVDGDHGMVRWNNHRDRLERHLLEHLADDTSANGGALVFPPEPPPPPPPPPAPKPIRVQAPSIIEARQQRNEAGRDELKSALVEAELTDFGDFAGRVRKAVADVAAARQMMNDLAAQHTRELDALREKHKAAEIDAADEYRLAEEALTQLQAKAKTLLNLFDTVKA